MWYDPNCIANILSLKKLSKKFEICYDSKSSGNFVVTKPYRTTHKFLPSPEGLHYYGASIGHAFVNINHDIIGVPTVRAASGLALSSRNGYLTADELALAPKLHQVMQAIATRLSEGERDVVALHKQFGQQLDAQGFKTDQIDIVDADTLQPLSACSQTAVILMAAFLGKARLIDNRTVNLHP